MTLKPSINPDELRQEYTPTRAFGPMIPVFAGADLFDPFPSAFIGGSIFETQTCPLT